MDAAEQRTERQVLTCAGLDDMDRALATDLEQSVLRLRSERAAIIAERQALEQAMQDLLLMAELVPPEAESETNGSAPAQAKAKPARDAAPDPTTDGDSAGSPADELPRDPKKLVRVIERMKPAAAASVVSKLEPRLAEDVVRGIKPAAAAKLLAALPPERAASLASAMAAPAARGEP
jgi:hypothetical protein